MNLRFHGRVAATFATRIKARNLNAFATPTMSTRVTNIGASDKRFQQEDRTIYFAFPICRPPKTENLATFHCELGAAVRARHSQFAGGNWRRIWRVVLQARPRSADRTRSPAAVSQKREFFKCLPETIGYFAPRMAKIGAQRLVGNSQKPAIGGPFSE